MNANSRRRLRPAGWTWRRGQGLAWAALALLGAHFVFAVAGCARPAPATKTEAKKPERYPLTGEILKIDPEHKVLVVRHDEIKGYMPAMTMEFGVSAGDIAVAKVGQRIRAQLIPSETGDIRLEKIWPDDNATKAAIQSSALQLRQDTHTRGKSVYREVGEAAPDFALYDQEGRVVQSARFRGKQVMLNFIFTRCPVATMCPAATAKMQATQKLAREAGVTNLELVSITLDPAFDTPGVLKDYAMARGIDTSNFSFLTGPETAIRDLLAQFGIIAEFEGDLIKHTLATLLIDPNGRIAHRADGSLWEPRDFVAKMKRQ